jgi:hypothetical protein
MHKPAMVFVAGYLALAPIFAMAWTTDGTPTDPILSLQYPKTQSAFQKIPQSILRACADPSYGSGWIFAEARRPEGDYLLLYGPVWTTPDSPETSKSILEYGTNGAIALVKQDGQCQQLWDADNAFNNFFPGNPGDKPTRAQAGIIRALAVDLVRRGELALGGEQPFLSALKATGHSDSQQDSVMVPLLDQLRKDNAIVP